MLSINNLKYSYKVKNVDFQLSIEELQVNSGEFVVLLGPNGSGKSTLLKLISKVLASNYGEIRVSNKNIDKYKRIELAKIIAYVPQTLEIHYPYSVFETVMMGRHPHTNLLGIPTQEDVNRVYDALEMTDTVNFIKKGINELSGGECQRVFLARALAQEAKLFLLDEPNAHMDVKHQLEIFNLLSQFTKTKNIAVILVSHDINLASNYADKIAFMKNGSLQSFGSKIEQLNKENIRNIFEIDSEVKYDEKTDFINVVINPFISTNEAK